jgi:hypothetical protein
MDTIKANTENIYIDIILEFETLDEERYAVSILNEIHLKKALDLICEETFLQRTHEVLNYKNDFTIITSEEGLEHFQEVMKTYVDIDINKKQD